MRVKANKQCVLQPSQSNLSSRSRGGSPDTTRRWTIGVGPSLAVASATVASWENVWMSPSGVTVMQVSQYVMAYVKPESRNHRFWFDKVLFGKKRYLRSQLTCMVHKFYLYSLCNFMFGRFVVSSVSIGFWSSGDI